MTSSSAHRAARARRVATMQRLSDSSSGAPVPKSESSESPPRSPSSRNTPPTWQAKNIRETPVPSATPPDPSRALLRVRPGAAERPRPPNGVGRPQVPFYSAPERLSQPTNQRQSEQGDACAEIASESCLRGVCPAWPDGDFRADEIGPTPELRCAPSRLAIVLR